MKKILLVFGSGGHSAQANFLIQKLSSKNQLILALEKDDLISQYKYTGIKKYVLSKVRGKNEFFALSIFNLILNFIESVILYVKTRPDYVISTGPGVAIAISYISKFFRKKIIFIESWSRVNTKSYAGKLIYPISDLFFVQWPELRNKYPKSVYAGRFT